ncbi:kinase [uncultured Kordia sp.]|uniref:helix-hairpin-helix domain-containing protein n=1 Tax=uncultured Kordia sp. TaxID=507699 RepID=UPI002613764D|nr:kinase [uncultured Kordia sp.]
MNTKTVKSIIDTTKEYYYVDNGDPMRGGMKDVYFSPDKSYVVAIYRDKQDANSIDRLKNIVTKYFDSFFKREGGNYYKELYSWPTDVIQENDKIGIIVPCYSKNFFFKKGYQDNDLLKGKEKDGKWFSSAKFRTGKSRLKLDKSELGNWLSYFQVCVNISRGVKRMHSAGLAHSDLSYKNVLIDPVSKKAAIIDIDGLVVPGLYPPDVIGTADFIAPEVFSTKHLPVNDPKRKLPNRLTDLHALAVLIYMYLLYRHPLRGGNYFGALDSDEEEDLLMGSKALFIEHPTDASNRNFKREYGDNEKKFYPWTDLKTTPYLITGPYLKKLFDQAFIKGLHNPKERPPAVMWEEALIKTNDLKLKCSNNSCDQQWFIYNNTKVTKCPFCGTTYKNSIPVLDFFYQFKPNIWKPENMRLVVYNNTTLHAWHVSRDVIRNEKLTSDDKLRVGYFAYHNTKWLLINERLPYLKDVTNNKIVNKGESIELIDGNKILLSNEKSGRVVTVTITN